ncbi:MAG TPA: dihydroorotate dehydrogenase [Candidatus Kapabacteria bacterium]|nr:dihydroorotate dehydrogenase [Candidatus Kapabacteria bacterium]
MGTKEKIISSSEVDLSVEIAGVRFAHPIFVASGTFGYGSEASRFCDISGIGAIVTKSVSWKPRPGNYPRRIVETPSGMLNSIGLANVGVEVFVKEKLPYLAEFDTKIIANIAASSIGEYCSVLEEIEKNATKNLAGYEINVSCPNVKDGGLSFGTNVEMVGELTRALRPLTKRLLILKLTPNVTSVAPFAKTCEDAGADAISLINTVIGMSVDIYSHKPRISTVTGGLSGPAIRPIAIAKVYEARKATSLPIIGIGGIANASDAMEFFIVGACAVQVGTMNFVHPDAAIIIRDELQAILQKQNCSSLKDIVGSLQVSDEMRSLGW